MLFIYIAIAATLFFIALDAAVTSFSPKDMYFTLVLLSQISEIMQCLHVTKYRRASLKRAEASGGGGSVGL